MACFAVRVIIVEQFSHGAHGNERQKDVEDVHQVDGAGVGIAADAAAFHGDDLFAVVLALVGPAGDVTDVFDKRFVLGTERLRVRRMSRHET